jgi:CheY-like chemotaxis protein
MTILLVEDSKLLRVANTRALAKAGYQVIVANDGEAALLRRLKSDERTKEIPVIVLSGLSQTNGERLIKEGAAAFFEKSEKTLANDAADLVEAVRGVLAKPVK